MHKKNESEKVYHVTKSKGFLGMSIFVKEQRVKDSCSIHYIRLRNTLMKTERNYQRKVPSNLIFRIPTYYSNRSYHSNVNLLDSIHAWGVTGLIDAEGSFIVKLIKSSKYRIG